ncbi:MAG: methylated-DNA--[protein]-cysteine S-methyltransferase [Vallitaleaceae bacterium]|jgi:methylated-DNA-[protein]-cysteine S-methyltransferase|nr:methylated-DNA--[protein]-cysteine S-methyltransferase [Vallitaleaceae bacterium]
MMYYTYYNSEICQLILVGDENGLSHIHMNTDERKRTFEILDEWIEDVDFFADTIKQLESYISGERREFDIVLNPSGTAFQKQVWDKLITIPYGEVRSYKEIAIMIGNEKASRAVGMANGKNPIPIIIPCHRVIGSNGGLTGYAFGLAIKEKLLGLEKMAH